MRCIRTDIASCMLIPSLLVACSNRGAADSFLPYKDPRQRFEIQSVVLATGPVDTKSTVEKLPDNLRPSDPATSKTVVLELTLASDRDELQEIKGSEFLLWYQSGGKSGDAPCVGLSMGDSEMWGLADNKGDASVFVRAKPSQKQKLLFVIPRGVGEASLQHRLADGGLAVIKKGVSLSTG